MLHAWSVLPAWLALCGQDAGIHCARLTSFWDLLVLQAMLMCRLKAGCLMRWRVDGCGADRGGVGANGARQLPRHAKIEWRMKHHGSI